MSRRLIRLARRFPGGPRALAATTAIVVAVAGLAGAFALGTSRAPVTVAAPTPAPTTSPSIVPTATPRPTPTPSPTPEPTPTLIYEDLSGIVTTADLAHRHPIAVMLDDSPAARPQSGLAAASVVWQAPVEGGIPRYMAMYQAGDPGAIGPVRSARLYFVRWAAEWRALYLHAGGPLPLKRWLRGPQKLVINADGKRTARVGYRAAPHNLYSDGERLRRYGTTIGAADDKIAYDPAKPGTLQPFRDAAIEADRGKDGVTIRIAYRTERVDYTYDRPTNTWLRSVDGRAQHDGLGKANRGFGAKGAGPRIAPTTVVVIHVPMRRSSRTNGPAMGAIEADSIGKGKAWVFADGKVTVGTWSKATAVARTRFLDADGAEIALPRGQLFVQVVTGTSMLTHKVAPAS